MACKWWLLAQCLLSFTSLLPITLAYCDDPSPAFPLPMFNPSSKELISMRNDLETLVSQLVKEARFNRTSMSMEVTSQTEALFSLHHTAIELDEETPGAVDVNGSTAFRIASMTKPFTVLAILQQHAAGKLHLDDPVNKYIAELNDPQNGTLPWHDITLRALSSQIAGIPRDSMLVLNFRSEHG